MSRAGAAGECRTTARCVTCADEGVPMVVVRAGRERDVMVCVDGRGDHHEVLTDLVAPVPPGERVLVHAGVALVRLPRAGDRGPG